MSDTVNEDQVAQKIQKKTDNFVQIDPNSKKIKKV
jgi:hypothetical protein